MKKLFLICLLTYMLIGTKTQAQYTKLMNFTNASNGGYPLGSLISDGTFLYGMTRSGGTTGNGTMFKIKPNGTGYAKLLDFAGATNGKNPQGSLISDGTFLYGMATEGGTKNKGTIFKIKPDGTGFIKLLDFDSATNGSKPRGSLLFDGTFLYGLTSQGGTNNIGTIFKIKPDGTGFLKILDFVGTSNGGNAYSTLITDGTYLYGTTVGGGYNNNGTIFKIKPDGTGFAKLADFSGATNGSYPFGSLISDSTFLYGMTSNGSPNNLGTIYKIKPDGTGFLIIYNFIGLSEGQNPEGSLIFDGSFLYGMTKFGGNTTEGTIFRIKPDGTGYFTLLVFNGSANGKNPQGSLISDGTFLYGMTSQGGTFSSGTVFKFALPVSTKDLSKNNTSINVYPNPAKTVLNIEIANTKTASVQIISTDGRLVKTVSNINSTNSQVNISDLSNGIYFIRVQSDGVVTNHKFVKE